MGLYSFMQSNISLPLDVRNHQLRLLEDTIILVISQGRHARKDGIFCDRGGQQELSTTMRCHGEIIRISIFSKRHPRRTWKWKNFNRTVNVNFMFPAYLKKQIVKAEHKFSEWNVPHQCFHHAGLQQTKVVGPLSFLLGDEPVQMGPY